MKAPRRSVGLLLLVLLVMLAVPWPVTRADPLTSPAAPWTVYFPLVHRSGPPSLDPTFGSNGLVIMDHGYPSAMALQADGKIVIGGWGQIGGGTNLAVLLRFNPNGTLDTSFGTGGGALPKFSGETATVAAIQSDGKVVEAGSVGQVKGAYWQLGRFTGAGVLDASFGSGGEIYDADSVPANALAIQPNGKIVVVESNMALGYYISRYLTDGTLDTSFGDNGQVPFATGYRSSDKPADVTALAVQTDGKLLAAGYTRYPCPTVLCNGTLTFARYNANGSFDTGFGQNGIAYAGGDHPNAILFALTLLPDGKILGAGLYSTQYSETSPNQNLMLVRLLPNGTPDPSFGTAGVAISDWPNRKVGLAAPAPARMALLPDGRIVLVASVGAPDAGDCGGFQVRWYQSNGARDLTFGLGGVVTLDAPSCDVPAGVAVQTDGKLVVAAGRGSATEGPSILLARFLAQ